MKKKQPLKVIAGTPDKPVIISGIEIQCYVLEDETRVFSQGGFLEAIGRSRSPTAGKGAFSNVDNLPTFLRSTNLKPFISKELILSTTPIKFKIKTGLNAIGYDAKLLHDVCEVYLKARDANALLPSQMHIAERAEILRKGFSYIGLIALIDEATGFQKQRDKDALKAILDAYLSEKFATWAKCFPDEFYIQIFRLKGWQWKGMAINRPSVVGRYTTDIVYKRLAPNIVDELEKRNPKNSSGNRRVRHHQWLTEDIGNPALAQHLYAVIALMKVSKNWDKFMSSLERVFPEQGDDFRFRLNGNNKNS